MTVLPMPWMPDMFAEIQRRVNVTAQTRARREVGRSGGSGARRCRALGASAETRRGARAATEGCCVVLAVDRASPRLRGECAQVEGREGGAEEEGRATQVTRMSEGCEAGEGAGGAVCWLSGERRCRESEECNEAPQVLAVTASEQASV